MTDWYLAPALAVLRAEINARWPDRDRTSDGSIGDAAHQASTSDHNPNVRGSVNAIDVDEDGIDPYVVLAAVQRHPSAHYWIYEREIADRDDGWRRRAYTGTNPHDKHLHVSIRQSATAEQDRRPWGLLEDDMTPAELLTADVLPNQAGAQYSVGGAIYDGAMWSKDTLARVKRIEALVGQLVGKDFTDEPAIVAGVLAGLTPEAIAAAIPQDLAQRVADELAARLTS